MKWLFVSLVVFWMFFVSNIRKTKLVSECTPPPKKCRKIPQNNDWVTKRSVFFGGCPAIYPSARAVKALLLVELQHFWIEPLVITWKPSWWHMGSQ